MCVSHKWSPMMEGSQKQSKKLCISRYVCSYALCIQLFLEKNCFQNLPISELEISPCWKKLISLGISIQFGSDSKWLADDIAQLEKSLNLFERAIGGVKNKVPLYNWICGEHISKRLRCECFNVSDTFLASTTAFGPIFQKVWKSRSSNST